jgi:homoserine kinase
MRLGSDHVMVRVPATSANLGPGFDALGLALDLWDEVEARAVVGPSAVLVEGEGAHDVPLAEEHLVVRAAHAALERVGAPQVGLQLHCVNRIPHGRGLGSSAAAVVAGALIARGLIVDPSAMNARAVFDLACEFEGHPDNAAPAVFGKGTIAWMDGAEPRAARFEPCPEVVAYVAVPPEKLSTRVARAVLPDRVARTDAAFNAGRSALLVHALTTQPTLLFDATADKLHQPYRAEVMPDTAAVITALREAGYAAAMSGAGPSVIVLAAGGPADLRALVPTTWTLHRLEVAAHGGTVARVQSAA